MVQALTYIVLLTTATALSSFSFLLQKLKMMKLLTILSALSLLACSHARNVNFGPQQQGIRVQNLKK